MGASAPAFVLGTTKKRVFAGARCVSSKRFKTTSISLASKAPVKLPLCQCVVIKRCVSSSLSTSPPCASSAATASSYTSSRAMTVFSEEQDVALSKVFEAAIFSAASAILALSSMIVTTLPCPTPKAGVPEEYPARTLFCEPVTTKRSASSIKRWVLAFEGGIGTICTRSGLRPMLRRF